MSLMGYEEGDIEKSLNALKIIHMSLDPDKAPRYARDKVEQARQEASAGLSLAIDLMEGLLEEGRV